MWGFKEWNLLSRCHSYPRASELHLWTGVLHSPSLTRRCAVLSEKPERGVESLCLEALQLRGEVQSEWILLLLCCAYSHRLLLNFPLKVPVHRWDS